MNNRCSYMVLLRVVFCQLFPHLDRILTIDNIYNRNNVFYVNLVTSEISRQLPILPTVGMTLSF